MNESMKKYISKKMNVSLCVINEYWKIIIKYQGEYDPSKTYAGPGYWGDKFIPDLWYSYPAYCHDGLYSGVSNKEGIDKWHADRFFLYAMLYIAKWNPIKIATAWTFYWSVVNFGSNSCD